MARRRQSSGIFLAIAASAVCITARAASVSADLQAVLDAAAPEEEIAVIVRYHGSYRPPRFRKPMLESSDTGRSAFAAVRKQRRVRMLAEFQRASQLDAGSLLDVASEGGARAVRLLWVADAIALRAKRELIWTLLARPDVEAVRLDSVQYAPIATAAAVGPPEWNIEDVHAPELWTRGFLGDGAVVAVFDTGVDAAHPELASAYRGGTNSWVDVYGQHAAPHDGASGHGTQALGIVVGGSLAGTSIGVAPGAKWIAAKIFNDAGVASESAIHLAFQWALDPDGNPATDDAPDVVTNSWDFAGEGTCSSAFQPDIDALRAADIAVVFSAGNYGPVPSSSVSPANNARVTSVGAVDENNGIALFSSRGPSACDGSLFPKVVAPGMNILTTDLSLAGSAQYARVEGTSFSAPHVAGVMALLRGAMPTATAAEVEAAVALSAHDLGPQGPDSDYGYGLVDAAAAYDVLSRPVDADGDGYTSYPASTDCDDQDASVHPGAHDVRRDGIDQDCNGYDQTIDVKYAVYAHDGSKLKLRVTTFLGAKAKLEIVGTGPLTWRPQRRDWIFEGATTGGPQKTLTIRGVEGEVSVKPRPPTVRP